MQAPKSRRKINKRIPVRFDDAEQYGVVKAAADKSELSLNKYIRRAAVEKARKELAQVEV